MNRRVVGIAAAGAVVMMAGLVTVLVVSGLPSGAPTPSASPTRTHTVANPEPTQTFHYDRVKATAEYEKAIAEHPMPLPPGYKYPDNADGVHYEGASFTVVWSYWLAATADAGERAKLDGDTAKRDEYSARIIQAWETYIEPVWGPNMVQIKTAASEYRFSLLLQIAPLPREMKVQ